VLTKISKIFLFLFIHLYGFRDNFNLLIPENTDVSAEDEMKHIVSWSESNKLYINFTKCRELVFCRSSLKSDSLPKICLIKHCTCNLWQVFVNTYWLQFYFLWTCCEHFDNVVKMCSQRFYPLQQMRKHRGVGKKGGCRGWHTHHCRQFVGDGEACRSMPCGLCL